MSTDQENSKAKPRQGWEKPRLNRIGSIQDVAGRPVPVDQAAQNKKS